MVCHVLRISDTAVSGANGPLCSRLGAGCPLGPHPRDLPGLALPGLRLGSLPCFWTALGAAFGTRALKPESFQCALRVHQYILARSQFADSDIFTNTFSRPRKCARAQSGAQPHGCPATLLVPSRFRVVGIKGSPRSMHRATRRLEVQERVRVSGTCRLCPASCTCINNYGFGSGFTASLRPCMRPLSPAPLGPQASSSG